MADRSVVYRLRADISGFKAQMGAAAASVQGAANKMTGASKESEKFRRGLSSVGDAAGKIGLAAAAGVGVAVATAAKFDKAMSGVEAATHESATNMERLREAAIKAGADTAFSASEAAAGIENLAKAGVSTNDILGGGLQGALDLAAAGSMEVADAAETAATAMTQFKLSGDDVPRIADALAAAAGKAQGEVSDMGYALSQSGTVAAQLGLTLEETTGTLAAMASSGLLGSDAGTSFKTFLMRLVPQTKEASDAMESIGFAAFDASGKLKSMEEIAGGLERGLRGMTDEQKQATLATIFGQDAIRAANIIYEQGAEGIEEWTTKVDDSGYAAETAATKLDNLAGDMEAFKGSLETALIGAGSGAQAPLRDLVQSATDAVNAFNGLPEAAQGAVTQLLAITAVGGGSLWAGSKIISGIADTRQALADLGDGAKVARGSLRAIGSGLQVAAIITGLNMIENALDDAFGITIDETNLGRDLNALSQGKTVENLEQVGQRVADLNIEVFKLIDTASGWTPGWVPFFGDTEIEQARQEILKVDEALAQMVESGNQEDAADAFAAIVEQAERAGASANDVRTAFEEYALALWNADPGPSFLTGATDAVEDLGDALGRRLAADAKKAEDAMTRAEGRVDTFAERLKKARERLEDARESATDTAEGFFGLGQKVDDTKVSLNGWIRDLEKQAKALRDFRENARDAAKRGLDEGLIASLREAGPAGAARLEQLANASEDQIARANEAWKEGRTEINKYVEQTTKVPAKKVTELEVKLDRAEAAIRRLERRLSEIKDEDVWINVRRKFAEDPNATPGMGPQVRAATGGYIMGPGTSTSDSIPALLSNGEYVVKAAAVERYGRHLFDSLNAQRYASGGLVGASAPISPAGMSIDYDRLARAMSTVRPMYGDVHVSDGYGGFKRQMLEDRQRAGIGGL